MVHSSCADCFLEANDDEIDYRESNLDPSIRFTVENEGLCEDNVEYVGPDGSVCADFADDECGFNRKSI